MLTKLLTSDVSKMTTICSQTLITGEAVNKEDISFHQVIGVGEA